MQVTVNRTQVGFGTLKQLVLAATFAAGITVGITAPVVFEHLPSMRSASTTQARVPVLAATNVNLGEGLLGNARANLEPQLVAHIAPLAGEGLLAGRRDALDAAVRQRQMDRNTRLLELNAWPDDELVPPAIAAGRPS